ncbi:hypothetical protein ABZ896_30520 [Streptomyces sp. NPDC047072]|uniref:hypothetical protein n=1 Tax=Streptomyces sp. NPDC047072 TaxID=3154809 RepID=UPI0033C633FD
MNGVIASAASIIGPGPNPAAIALSAPLDVADFAGGGAARRPVRMTDEGAVQPTQGLADGGPPLAGQIAFRCLGTFNERSDGHRQPAAPHDEITVESTAHHRHRDPVARGELGRPEGALLGPQISARRIGLHEPSPSVGVPGHVVAGGGP